MTLNATELWALGPLHFTRAADEPMEPTIHEVPLRVLYSVRYLHVGEDQWDFYINYVPELPELGNPDLDRAFGGGGDSPILFVGDPWLRTNARPLIDELRALVPPSPPVAVGGVPIQLVGGFWAFSHYLEGWSQAGPEQIEWVKDLRFPNGNPVQNGTQGWIRVDELSDAARSALRRLDGFAIATARERFAAKVAEASLAPPGVNILPQRTKVFISYRRPDMQIARAFHALLGSYGHSAIFEPYLDLHDLELGSLRKQLRERIEIWADLFMPLVSDSYAAPGSISAEELGWALARADNTADSSFLAPIFIAQPGTEIAAELGDLLRGNIMDASEVTVANEGLRSFLVTCARA